ncbi:NAD(P)/FAD-dependent oxidoreductase [Candidatus Poriferisodalis sp.]|uniref:NAD(P)/FAD-dependent oxidoreductase n=1 Tax=Candidatus Poriferisodalis sp. TaxID=3101277 RepID=UPI003B020AE7
MTAASNAPRRDSYDVVIVGGAVMGSSIAWALSACVGFDGSVLVIERDPSYANASTTHTNSCMRQQFSNPLNVQISRFSADFVRNFRERLGGDPEIPDIFTHHFGYMYLAGDEQFAETLRRNQAIQAALGADTRIMNPAEIKAAYPFYAVDDIICGSHNLTDEGYFDSGTMFDWWRRKARQNGVEYVTDEVVGLARDSGRVSGAVLASGSTVRCGTLVNAAGPRAVEVARMVGATLPVEPRKRFTFVFDAAEALDAALPLTIDPTGVHMRSDGDAYMCGCTPDVDPAVSYDDFAMDHDIFEAKVWPVLAHRVPAFERLKVTRQWAGHYAYNTLDHNVVVGPHHEIENFIFANGFSGHGMQQSPAIGRAVSEWIAYGKYRTLDLTPLGYRRIVDRTPFVESAII